jgi:hypothetical protein
LGAYRLDVFSRNEFLQSLNGRALNNIKQQEVLVRTNSQLYFETTRAAKKMTYPTILVLLRMYSLLQQRVYRTVA